MIEYIEYLHIPTIVALAIIVLFVIMQLVGEFLEFKGKVVPECVKIRKFFTRRKHERLIMQEVPATLDEVKQLLSEMHTHYDDDNITLRDEWIKSVNNKLDSYDICIRDLVQKLDKNNQDTLALLIDNKRNTIINFASYITEERNPVTREQFKRIFKIYEEYEDIIESNGLTNGEMDIAIRIIEESYTSHLKNHTFIEDIRGYNT